MSTNISKEVIYSDPQLVGARRLIFLFSRILILLLGAFGFAMSLYVFINLTSADALGLVTLALFFLASSYVLTASLYFLLVEGCVLASALFVLNGDLHIQPLIGRTVRIAREEPIQISEGVSRRSYFKAVSLIHRQTQIHTALVVNGKEWLLSESAQQDLSTEQLRSFVKKWGASHTPSAPK